MITHFSFQEDRIDKAVTKAKVLRELAKGKTPEEATYAAQISDATFRRYLTEGNFLEKLKELAPYIADRQMEHMIQIAEGQLDVKDNRYKAIIELLKATMPVAQGKSDYVEFDSGVRRQQVANDGNNAQGVVLTVTDGLRVLAKDPYRNEAIDITPEGPRDAPAVEPGDHSPVNLGPEND